MAAKSVTTPPGRPRGHSLAAAPAAVLDWIGLAVASLAVLWPLGLTHRVLSGVDALTYFTPYWAYRAAQLRAGRLPLWNPYLFLGAPFLANPQAAVLYPLHWPLIGLDAPAALVWSAILHVWLACGFAYTFARRSLGLPRPAAWLTGALFGLGGFTLARVENINQLNALAWLPALPWLLDETIRARGWRRRVRWAVALTLALALQFLAGHTQTSFINLVGLGLYALYPAAAALARARGPLLRRMQRPAFRLVPLLCVLPALLLAAAQFVPSLELNALGLRTGGLPYRLAVSFSLRPRLLAQSFLPPFGAGLPEAFGSEGYAEFVSYLGIAGLTLAACGALGLGRASHLDNLNPRESSSRRGALLTLAAAGVLLALGAYDPLYYVLWRVVPGFALFRAPARWLALYALGMAGLAGMGLAALTGPGGGQGHVRPKRRTSRRALAAIAVVALGGLALAAYQQWPGRITWLGWAAAASATGVLLWAARRRPALARAGLIALVLVELWAGSRALPFTQATTPAALSLRNAPAALLAATAGQPPAGRERFLSMSDIRFDPGDLAQLRGLAGDRLPADAVARFVRAAKQMEVIAPNLSLELGLPALDGYDGGVLPLAGYVRLQSLFLPPDRLSPDGRLREQLRAIPPDRLLDLTGTRFVITDKQNDLWSGDVYYDLEQAVTVSPGQEFTLDLSGYPAFSATALGLVSHLQVAPRGAGTLATITLADASGDTRTLTLAAPADTAPGTGPAGSATVARPWPGWMGQGQDYVAVKDFPALPGCVRPVGAAGSCPLAPVSIRVRVLPAAGGPLALRGLSLVDRRTGAHQSLTLSPRDNYRRIESGDVKVYERQDAPGRAWLVHRVETVANDDAALARLADPSFDPRQSVVVTGDWPGSPAGAAGGNERVTVTEYDPERIVLRAQVTGQAALVLPDAYYPGWRATVDGRPTPVARANFMFRAVPLSAGTHEVVFSYTPTGWRAGLIASAATALFLLGAWAVTRFVV